MRHRGMQCSDRGAQHVSTLEESDKVTERHPMLKENCPLCAPTMATSMRLSRTR